MNDYVKKQAAALSKPHIKAIDARGEATLYVEGINWSPTDEELGIQQKTYPIEDRDAEQEALKILNGLEITTRCSHMRVWTQPDTDGLLLEARFYSFDEADQLVNRFKGMSCVVMRYYSVDEAPYSRAVLHLQGDNASRLSKLSGIAISNS